ncbi:MAG: hypothetical protein EDR02_14960 [Actinobacteria bacterium]|nr:MAG: hypothetical protein EDR02_14960 [Actinomycetota bacterium]RIK04394.1 MAG: hypothetical protein DCC48_13525 [Acidobacteriota bacterium]
MNSSSPTKWTCGSELNCSFLAASMKSMISSMATSNSSGTGCPVVDGVEEVGGSSWVLVDPGPGEATSPRVAR